MWQFGQFSKIRWHIAILASIYHCQSSLSCFYWGLFLRPVSQSQLFEWSKTLWMLHLLAQNKQSTSSKLLLNRLAMLYSISHQLVYILCHLELERSQSRPFSHVNIIACNFVTPLPPAILHPHLYEYLWYNKNYLKWWAIQVAINTGASPLKYLEQIYCVCAALCLHKI